MSITLKVIPGSLLATPQNKEEINLNAIAEKKQEIMDIINTEISKTELRELLKLQTDTQRRGTLYQLMNQDEDIDEERIELNSLTEQILRSDIPEELKDIIMTAFARKDELLFDVAVNTYRAGMTDLYRILRGFDLVRE